MVRGTTHTINFCLTTIYSCKGLIDSGVGYFKGVVKVLTVKWGNLLAFLSFESISIPEKNSLYFEFTDSDTYYFFNSVSTCLPSKILSH
jgi:hypothetical protein